MIQVVFTGTPGNNHLIHATTRSPDFARQTAGTIFYSGCCSLLVYTN